MHISLHSWNTPQAGQYQQHIRSKIIGYDFIYELMLHMLKNIQTLDHILVVGAGGGQELVTISSQYPQAKFSAVEPSVEMLKAAKDAVERANVTLNIDWFNCELQPAMHVRVDAATCHLVLHFLEKREKKQELLENIASHMKPGALFFISAVMLEGAGNDELMLQYWKHSMLASGAMLEGWERYSQSFGVTNHPITRAELVELLNNSGFVSVVPYFKSYTVEAFVAIKGGT